MTRKKLLLLGCAGFLVLGILAAMGLGLFISHIAKDLDGVTVQATGPDEVKVGDTFDLVVSVSNQRNGKALKLEDVDINNEYLAGFTVSSTKPQYKSTMRVPVDDSQSFTFDLHLPPGKSTNVVFTLRAVKAGIYKGDVDATEGLQFVTALAQTVVTEK